MFNLFLHMYYPFDSDNMKYEKVPKFCAKWFHKTFLPRPGDGLGKHTFGINRMGIVGKDDVISYLYCHNGVI